MDKNIEFPRELKSIFQKKSKVGILQLIKAGLDSREERISELEDRLAENI